MNKTEAAKVMAVLASAYARDLDQAQMAVWYGSALEHCPAHVGNEAAARIVKQDSFFPTPARFSEMRRTIERGMEPTYAALPAPVPTPTQQERIKAHIAAAREHIANAKTPRRSA